MSVKLPTTRYYGSKRRFASFLENEFSKYSFDTVFDGFGGTASVSIILASMGKQVTYNDFFRFNRITAQVLLNNRNALNVDEAKKMLKSIKPFEGVVSKNFDGIFYTASENKWLDGCIQYLQGHKNEKEKLAFMYCLFQACLKKRPFNLFHRANLSLRQRKVPRSFGNLTTWNTSFQKHIISSLQELQSLEYSFSKKPNVLSEQDIMKVKPSYDLVYLDPPYVSSNGYTDNYNRKYHFLEGLSNYDNWQARIDYTSPVKELKCSQVIKQWNDPKTSKDLLFDLVCKHKSSIVILSYSENGRPSLEEIRKEFKSKFDKVRVKRIETTYALGSKSQTEILITGLPK